MTVVRIANPSANDVVKPREIAIANRHPRLRLDRRAVARLFSLLDANAQDLAIAASAVPPGELSIVFLTNADLAKLHARFLYDPALTDVITFEGDRQLGTAGEICVSADTAVTYSRVHGGDLSSELTLYLVHGWLHLAGHDDRVAIKKRAMRRAESRAMKILQRADALPKFSMRPRRQMAKRRR